MECTGDVITPTVSLCRDPVRLFHPTHFERRSIIDRIRELVRATYALQWRHKAVELQHASECYQTATCVLGFDQPMAGLMEDDVDPGVRYQTIKLLAPPNMTSPVSPRIATPWMDALSVLCCEMGKPRELEKFVEALWHSPELHTERGTTWVMWLCALSCLVFPLDDAHPLTRSVVDTVTCALANKSLPSFAFSPIQACVLTIVFMASSSDVITPLSPWNQVNAHHDDDLRLEALVHSISEKIVVGKEDCLCQENDNEILT